MMLESYIVAALIFVGVALSSTIVALVLVAMDRDDI
jgi:hypothetical protein